MYKMNKCDFLQGEKKVIRECESQENFHTSDIGDMERTF